MREIPRWLGGYIQKDSYSCPNETECMLPFEIKGVTGIGIRDETIPGDRKKSCLYIEYICPKCSLRTVIELHEMTLLEFATMVLDDFEDILTEELEKEKEQKKSKRDPNAPKAKKRLPGSKITREEVQRAKDIINNAATWDDFLGKIGADPDSLSRSNDSADEYDTDNIEDETNED